MKKIFYLMSAALVAVFGLSSCGNENKQDLPNLDDLAEDGFYVFGEATGATDLTSAYMMGAGFNEAADNAKREGMFEKYIILKGGKEFSLLLKEGTEQTYYGADLNDLFDPEGENDQVSGVTVSRGELVIGENAPKMKVQDDGLYHIVLDLNKAGDLANAQIIVVPVVWGVSGGMNGWGFTAMEIAEQSETSITYKLDDQELATNGTFKFKYGNGWKIQLDDAGNVKANTNLGLDMIPGGENISVTDAGKYTITLTYTLKGGEIAKSYDYNAECTEVSQLTTTMYMIGNVFGNWDWASADVVELIPVHSNPGMFWCTRYFSADNEFKFCPKKEWNGDFCTLGTVEGSDYFTTPSNNMMNEAGIYTIVIDAKNDKMTVKPAAICGMGDCFGSWDEGAYPFTCNQDGTMNISVANDGSLRLYSDINNSGNWWQSEFNIFDGKIVYRADGNDQDAVTATAGQTVTLDFNAGTGSIR